MMLKKITDLLPDSLMAGMKSWDQGSLAERVEILLEMYKSASEEVARLEAEKDTKFDDGYTAGFEDGVCEAQSDRSGEM
jgi:hypothetical protein